MTLVPLLVLLCLIAVCVDAQTLVVLQAAYNYLEPVDDWAGVSRDKAETAKSIFRIAFLEKQVEGAATPDELCSTLLDHCVKTTSASRKYMCENSGRIVPKDYVAFPGKMDHSSCLAINVSHRYPALPPPPAVPAPVDNDEIINVPDE